MKIKAVRKYTVFFAGIILTILMASFLFKTDPKYLASHGQTVVKWKDMYWFPCKYSWKGYCLWPLRRKHVTYKVTVNKGTPLRDEKGMPIAAAGGKTRTWTVYDAAAWNGIENRPWEKKRYPDYEPIADNEYVVLVETRYRLFHSVENTLQVYTEKP